MGTLLGVLVTGVRASVVVCPECAKQDTSVICSTNRHTHTHTHISQLQARNQLQIQRSHSHSRRDTALRCDRDSSALLGCTVTHTMASRHWASLTHRIHTHTLTHTPRKLARPRSIREKAQKQETPHSSASRRAPYCSLLERGEHPPSLVAGSGLGGSHDSVEVVDDGVSTGRSEAGLGSVEERIALESCDLLP